VQGREIKSKEEENSFSRKTIENQQ